MIEKTLESYISKLRDRAKVIKSGQLGNDMYNQTMAKKEMNVLECIAEDLGELKDVKKHRCFTYWNC